jgi:hypothetical protein
MAALPSIVQIAEASPSDRPGAYAGRNETIMAAKRKKVNHTPLVFQGNRIWIGSLGIPLGGHGPLLLALEILMRSQRPLSGRVIGTYCLGFLLRP